MTIDINVKADAVITDRVNGEATKITMKGAQCFLDLDTMKRIKGGRVGDFFDILTELSVYASGMQSAASSAEYDALEKLTQGCYAQLTYCLHDEKNTPQAGDALKLAAKNALGPGALKKLSISQELHKLTPKETVALYKIYIIFLKKKREQLKQEYPGKDSEYALKDIDREISATIYFMQKEERNAFPREV